MLLMEATPVVTAAMIQPVADQLTSALPVIAGVGISILAVMLAFRAIPKVIKMFAK